MERIEKSKPIEHAEEPPSAKDDRRVADAPEIGRRLLELCDQGLEAVNEVLDA